MSKCLGINHCSEKKDRNDITYMSQAVTEPPVVEYAREVDLKLLRCDRIWQSNVVKPVNRNVGIVEDESLDGFKHGNLNGTKGHVT